MHAHPVDFNGIRELQQYVALRSRVRRRLGSIGRKNALLLSRADRGVDFRHLRFAATLIIRLSQRLSASG